MLLHSAGPRRPAPLPTADTTCAWSDPGGGRRGEIRAEGAQCAGALDPAAASPRPWSPSNRASSPRTGHPVIPRPPFPSRTLPPSPSDNQGRASASPRSYTAAPRRSPPCADQHRRGGARAAPTLDGSRPASKDSSRRLTMLAGVRILTPGLPLRTAPLCHSLRTR